MPEVDTTQVEAAQQTLRNEAIPKPNESKGLLGNVYQDQTQTRWGVEAGPATFNRHFQSILTEADNQLALLDTKLNEYDEGLEKAVEDFKSTDGDVAATQRSLETSEQEADEKVDQQAESQPDVEVPPKPEGEDTAQPLLGGDPSGEAPTADSTEGTGPQQPATAPTTEGTGPQQPATAPTSDGDLGSAPGDSPVTPSAGPAESTPTED